MREANAVDKYIRVDPNTKLFVPNWMYRDVLPFSLGPDPMLIGRDTDITLTDNLPKSIPFKLPHASLEMDAQVGNPIEINQIVSNQSTNLTSANSRYTVFVTDMGDQRQFMNYPVHISTFAGTGQLSARLSEDWFLPTRHVLNVTFQKSVAGGVNQTARLYFHGRKFYTWSTNLQSHPQDHKDMILLINKLLERRKYVFPYWLTTEQGAVSVPANQTIENDALVGSEGHFEATHICRCFGTTGGGAQSDSPFTLELINPQTRQSLMNGAIHSYMIGDAKNPQPLPCPFIIPAGQLLRFKITDVSGAANTVFVTLRGRKIRADFKDINQVKRDLGIQDVTMRKPSVGAVKNRKAEMVGA